MQKQEIIDGLLFRHACKEFDETKKISEDDFKFILESARLSPTSFGFEPFRLIVVQDATLREKLKAKAWGAQLQSSTASHFVVCLAMKSPLVKYDSPYIADFMKRVQQMPEDKIKFKTTLFEGFQKNDFDLNSDRTLLDWSSKQAYIVLANMMTCAALIGIDSCPIEGYHIADTDAILAKDCGVDIEKYSCAYMVAFGYRKHEPKREKTRRPIEEIVTLK